MPRTKISEFSATAGSNTDIDGINIAEGCSPSGINDAIRELMAQLKDFQAGTAGDSFNGPVGTTTPAAGAFTSLSASGTFALTGDQVQISEGGTGQTTANAAFNALAPSQATHAGKYLKTDGTNTSWDALDISTADITGTLPVANGGTGVTSSTGTGSVVLSASPTFTGTVNAAALTLSGAATLNGGTANGIAYLNGSKVLTTGSALSFDGANLQVGGNSQPIIRAVSSSTNNATARLFTDGDTVYMGSLNTSTTGSSVPVVFQIGGTEQARLTSTGLGIGTSSPTNRLSVDGNANITGNTTLGDASTDTVTVNGYMGVGGAGNAGYAVNIASTSLTGSSQYGVVVAPVMTSSSTANAVGIAVLPSTAAAAVTYAATTGIRIDDFAKGAGSTVTNQHGVRILDQTQGTNNYGITSLVSSGTNKWNIYASGTAANYFAGNVGIGYTTTPDAPLTLDVASGGGTANTSYDAINLSSGSSTYPAKIKVEQGSSSTIHSLSFWTSNAAAPTEKFKLNPTEAVFNDPGNDYDFRVESDTNTHALFVDAGNSRVGVNQSVPDTAFSVNGIIQSTGESSAVSIANGATANVITPNRGFSYINISRGDTALHGLLLLVFRTTTTLEIVSTVSDKTSGTYSASVSGTALQITNSSGSTMSFYASGICMAFGTGD